MSCHKISASQGNLRPAQAVLRFTRVFFSSCTYAAFEQCTQGTGIGSATSLCCLHFEDKLSFVGDRQDLNWQHCSARDTGALGMLKDRLNLSRYSLNVSFYFGIHDSYNPLCLQAPKQVVLPWSWHRRAGDGTSAGG